MEEQRPDPEKLLKQVQEEERQKKEGKLKIYLGASPGVGKTYTMLHDAIALREQGLDVVIGVVESHGRQEIESLIQNLEILPREAIEYKGQTLHEFNLEATLKRNPGLVLMDEMAHTNAQGLLHDKRWQDIKEILDRGIDVYTTLNVQHIESRSDIAAQIIHVQIKETVPDSMIELADTIELVDLPPEDLLRRLQEGKVYISPQIELAKEYFFRKGNLIALRELALRVTAERVGVQVLLYRQGQGIKNVWPTKEKILVCVGPGTESIRLIRIARRLAAGLQSEWTAVYVDSPKIHLSEAQRNSALENLRLAEQLGAETRTLVGNELVQEIITFAQEQNITQIIVWKTIRALWKDFLFRSLANEIVRHSGSINIYIVTGAPGQILPSKLKHQKRLIPWEIYWISTGMIFIATVINFFLYRTLGVYNLMIIYLLGVTFVALFGQMGPSILASILSVLAYGFFFMPAFHGFTFSDIKYFITLLIMLLVTQVVSHLTILSRRQIEVARLAERHTAALYTLTRKLATTRGLTPLLQAAVQYLSELFDSEVLAMIYEDHKLTVRATSKIDHILDEKDQSIAQWVYDLGQNAGIGTHTLPSSNALYVPLRTSEKTMGVLRLKPILSGHLLTPEQMRLLEACASQIALGIEVDQLHDQAKESPLKNF